jgi:methyl-accepting chemotaxis protein
MKNTVKSRIIRLAILSTLVPVVALLLTSTLVLQRLRGQIGAEMNAQLQDEMSHITSGVRQQVADAHELVLQQVGANMRVASGELARAGGFSLEGATLHWSAVNQLSKEAVDVDLPAVRIGGTRLEPVDDPERPVPLVDRVRDLVGGTVTVFQRMNEAGDMLRVATTVVSKQGKRAIGTYIPAQGTDGAANPVVAAALKGEVYTGKAFVVDSWYTTAYTPLKDAGGRVIGMLYVGLKQESIPGLRKGIMDVVVGKTGYVWVLGGEGDHKGVYVISQHGKRDGENILGAKDAEGQPVIARIIEQARAAQGGIVQVRYLWTDAASKRTAMKVAAVSYFAPWDWVIGASAWEEEFMEPVLKVKRGATQTLVISLLVGLAAFALSAWYALSSAGRMARPIARLSEIARQAEQGDLRQDQALADPELAQIGEVRELAGSFGSMITSVRGNLEALEGQRAYLGRNVEHLLRAMDRFAAGDLTVSVPVEREDELGRLILGFNRALATIRELMAGLAGNAGELQGASDLLGESSAALMRSAATTRDQAQEVTGHLNGVDGAMQAMAAATEEMSATAQEIAQSSQTAAQVAVQAVQSAEQVNTTIMSLDESSDKIGSVIKVIDQIARQTNLLALNATIEAARAGEAGKGFAVVAGEVKELASGTTRATEDIRRMIEDIRRDTTRTVDEIGSILEVVTRIRDLQASVAGAIEEQAATTREFAGQISGVARSTGEASASIAQVLGGADASRLEAERTAGAAERLADLSSTLNQRVSQFKYAG